MRAAIFDLDGTLVDSAGMCTAILNAMLRERGGADVLSRDDVVPHLSAGGARMMAALLGRHCGDAGQAIAEFRARYSAMPTPEDCLYPEVRAGLHLLHRRGVRLGICSNKPQALCDKILAELDLGRLFTAIIGGRAALPPKPAPDLLVEAMRGMGVCAQAARFVGDSALDAACARAAGVGFIGVTYGYETPDSATGHARFGDVVDALLRDIGGSRAGAVAA